MRMNPRQIAKLCKHLRDAGATYVTVAPDGTVHATFPQPSQYWANPPWWLQQPSWVPPQWTITYTDTTSDPNVFAIGDANGIGTDVADGLPSGTYTSLGGPVNSPVFVGYNTVGDHMVGQTIKIQPDA